MSHSHPAVRLHARHRVTGRPGTARIRSWLLASAALLAALVAALVLGGGLWSPGVSRPGAAPPAGPLPAPAGASADSGSVPAGFTVEPRAVRILHAWDARRSRAYAAGSAGELRRLYAPGSAAGRADVHLLRSYAERGLRVRGMRMQLLRVKVLANRSGRLRLRVVDRLTGAVAVGHGQRVRLPRDRATGHVLTLRREAGRWLVAAVR